MTLRLTAALLSVLLATGAQAAPRPYALPEETAELAPGPNLETVQGNCGACHSSEYISTQPRTFTNPRAFWTAEVTKMQHAYGAPVADADVPAIVDYLVATYGK
jgi:mono/diheme cytochrome c family protein